LSGTPGSAVKNSFIFNFAGDLVAIVNNSGETIPAFSYNAFWRAFLKGQSVQPSLGVNYLDLSAIKAEGINSDKGAYLYASTGAPAVLVNSPAAAAGLAAGDIITAIDNQELNAANGLADVLSAYNAGDKITVSYRRAGRDMEAEITLGLLETSKK
jgi:S1-C subfamily serine protease